MDEQTNPLEEKEKGKFLDTVGSILEYAPDLFCTIFPENCAANGGMPGGSNQQAPIIVQQKGQRDWLTIALIVVVLAILLILILKK